MGCRYELIPAKDLIQLHVDIGLLLISKGAHSSRDIIDELFAFAVSHINMALSKCSNTDTNAGIAIEFTPSQHIVFAKLNLRAGQKAVKEKSDFALAEVHLKAGLSFLPRNSWLDQYDLTLQIHDEYSNVSILFCCVVSYGRLIYQSKYGLTVFTRDAMAWQVLFVQRNLEELHLHVDTVLKNATCIGDKIKAHEQMISVLTLKGATSEALDHAKSTLGSLGFPFPPSINTDTVKGVINSLMSKILSFTPDTLRALHVMTEKVPLQAMKIMSAVHLPYSFSSPTMFQMIACQMVQLTIKHGLCVQSAEAFANLGYCINALFKNFDAGYRISKLSLVILERFKANNEVAKVHFIIYGFLSVWKEPLQATIEGLQSAVNTGLVTGDHKNVLHNQVVMYRQMMLAGCHLSILRDRLLGLCRDMVRLSQNNWYTIEKSAIFIEHMLLLSFADVW